MLYNCVSGTILMLFPFLSDSNNIVTYPDFLKKTPKRSRLRHPILAVLSPKLIAVDDILPKNVRCGRNGGNRIKINLRHPDGHGGVFLSKSLTGRDGIIVMASDAPTDQELQYADDQRHDSQTDFTGDIGIGLIDHEFHGCAGQNGQRSSPQIEGGFMNAGQFVMNLGHEILEEPGDGKRKDEDRSRLPADMEERLHEGHLAVRAQHREQQRSECSDTDIADKKIGGDERDTSSQHSRYDGRRGSCRSQYADQSALRHQRIVKPDEEIDGNAAQQFDQYQPKLGLMKMKISRRQLTKGKQQHREDQIGNQERETANPLIGQ